MKTRAWLTLLAVTVALVVALTPSPRSAAQSTVPARLISAEEIEPLRAIQARHKDDVLDLPGVQGFGIGLSPDGQSAELLVLVTEGSRMPTVPSSLDGTPVRVQVVPPLRLEDGIPGCTPPCHANQLPLPVQMGNSAYSTLRCSACTLGFKACDATRGQFVYVTNAHCTRDAQLQQAWIGSLTRHVSRSDAPNCPLTPAVGTVAAHADPCDPANTTVDASKIDSDFSLTSSPIRDIGFPFATPGTPVLGMLVQKSGRTTGLTFGRIDAVGMDVNVPAGEYVCGPVTLNDQLMITAIAPSTDWSDNGDSGSAVLDLNGYLVGLAFAGGGTLGYANTIQNVLAELDLTLNLFGCTEDCAFARAAEGAEGADDLLALGYRFRDEVLPRSARGRAYADLFGRHTKEVVGLMVMNPRLLLDTRSALERHRETLRSLADHGRATVTAAEIAAVKQLLASFAAEADGELHTTLKGLIRDLDNPAVRADFGITVR